MHSCKILSNIIQHLCQAQFSWAYIYFFFNQMHEPQESRDSISTVQGTRISNKKEDMFVNLDPILYLILPRGTEEKSEVRCYGEFLTFH